MGASRVPYALGTEGWPVAKCDGFRAESFPLRKIEGIMYLFYISVPAETSPCGAEPSLRFNRVLLPSWTTFLY